MSPSPCPSSHRKPANGGTASLHAQAGFSVSYMRPYQTPSPAPAWEKHELQSKGRTIFKKEPPRILTLNKTWIHSQNEMQGFTLPVVLAKDSHEQILPKLQILI